MRAPGPVDRVRSRFAEAVGRDRAEELPRGYQRIGRAVLLRLPDDLRSEFPLLGRLYAEELRATPVLRVSGPVEGDWRVPRTERIYGDPGPVEVRENGIRFRLDPAQVLFSAGNRTERRRAGRLTQPGETVIDLFAGIGYFALPAAVHGNAQQVFAVEENPESYGYLRENISINRVESRVVPVLGDNRQVALPRGSADRVFLGYLPTSVPFVSRALDLLRPTGGTLHVHLVAGTRESLSAAESTVRGSVAAAGGVAGEMYSREVKPYGPGRRHLVVDARAVPRTTDPSSGGS